ncbi:DNA polymerase III subunit gamma/tau [Halalkalibacillus sediminis]|uniref:DNA-directed DNA polymerase n=1 Tax=Halalkalibacillus sediminis TaxID=2018042 RepID=A0A2I0QT03_9BACI|nr:DNA polymerase III subunit gamma/tau [Halalkalibacillus sediminis]PKR77472.1 DNA polymerase III subunit gamma/tau [Halalkalibacillus sediminis]
MAYQALYRVWRPQRFQDVVGQQHITRTLQNAMAQSKVAHAYLFSGPRGTGKTSAAKIFAKAINCEHAPVKEPCGECKACQGIQDGSISDMIEIDAASNNGVEDIREIRDKVKYAPTAVSYKVYIIDEVHMLSTGAFNALLKTLEEPPKHVIFILATTEPHKIPLTIISRCQRFDFKRISQQVIVDRMAYILEEENFSYEKNALIHIGLVAEGGMRDALSLLDQSIAFSDDDYIDMEDVLAVTGSIAQENLLKMVEALVGNDAKEALSILDNSMQDGKDPGRFVYDLIYLLRDLFMYNSAEGMEDVMVRAIPDDSFKEHASKISSQWLEKAIALLNETQQDMKWTNSPKVLLEIALLNLQEINVIQEPKGTSEASPELLDEINKLKAELKQLKDEGVQPKEQVQQQTPSKRPQPQRGNRYKVPYEKVRYTLSEATKEGLQGVKKNWAAFMDGLRKSSPPAHAKLVDSTPRAASSQSLILSFKYEIHCSLVLENQEMIESALAQYTGTKLTIIPVPDSEWQTIREDYLNNQSSAEQDEAEQPQEEDELVSEARKLVGDDLLEIKDS